MPRGKAIEREPFTPNQLARRYGIGVRHIRAAIKRGDLIAVTGGSAWNRCFVADFLAWLDTTRFKPPPIPPDPIEERVNARIRQEQAAGA